MMRWCMYTGGGGEPARLADLVILNRFFFFFARPVFFGYIESRWRDWYMRAQSSFTWIMIRSKVYRKIIRCVIIGKIILFFIFEEVLNLYGFCLYSYIKMIKRLTLNLVFRGTPPRHFFNFIAFFSLFRVQETSSWKARRKSSHHAQLYTTTANSIEKFIEVYTAVRRVRAGAMLMTLAQCIADARF